MKSKGDSAEVKSALLEALEGQPLESGIHLKTTTRFNENDEEVWYELEKLYRHAAELRKIRRPTAERREQAQFMMLAASILNSSVTHGRFAFVLTRDETLALVRSDKNWRRYGVKFTIKNEGPWWGKFTAYMVRVKYLSLLVEGSSRRGDGYTLGPAVEFLLAYAFGSSKLDDIEPSLRDQTIEVTKHVRKQRRQISSVPGTKAEPPEGKAAKPQYRTHVPDPEDLKKIREQFKFGPGDDDDIL